MDILRAIGFVFLCLIFCSSCGEIISKEESTVEKVEGVQEGDMFGFQKRSTGTLEEKMLELNRIGLQLNAGRSLKEILGSGDREEFETEGFDTLLFTLANEVETGQGAGESYTNQLYSFDTECIEDTGDYALVAMRIAEMFRDQFVITAVTDNIDWDSERAVLSFECQGKVYSKKVALDGDWFDPQVLELFIRVSTDMKSERKLGIGITDDQTLFLCVMTPKQMKMFNNLTGSSMRVLLESDL
jgi:hypothetical protein